MPDQRHRGAHRKSASALGLFNANIDADIFYRWTTQSLLPNLPPASVAAMDNATFHKRADIQAAITNVGHTLDFPPYSPDLNPIEESGRRSNLCAENTNAPLMTSAKLNRFI